MDRQECALFVKTVEEYYAGNKRILPWRATQDPYKILVSEVMLQQTQVSRILEKYPPFITSIPDFHVLAASSLPKLLALWQGIGYNRRALYLKKSAQIVCDSYGGILPTDPKLLEALPGIGRATAASICVFAYNIPLVFIETNIRRVFIHHFFKNDDDVHDSQLVPYVEMTLNRDNPREWYFALMDYGSWLGRSIVNPNRKSKHYSVQKPFLGSGREIRGQILKLLLTNRYTMQALISALGKEGEKVTSIVAQLTTEGFIVKKNGKYEIRS